MGKKPKLAAANGTNIELDGEAVVKFNMGGRRCGMKFLDAYVKKPLGAVSAMEDEGNTVVFSRKWGSYVENDATGERIPMIRKGGTQVTWWEAWVDKENTAMKGGGEKAGVDDDGRAGEEGGL
mgnify:CR=1 FL=1